MGAGSGPRCRPEVDGFKGRLTLLRNPPIWKRATVLPRALPASEAGGGAAL